MNSNKCILISVVERNITTQFFPEYDMAFNCMEKELEETMSQGRKNYTKGEDYEITEKSAWSNANKDAKCDWMIVNI